MSKNKHEVVFYTYPKFLFCWPLIVMGVALWFLAVSEPGPSVEVADNPTPAVSTATDPADSTGTADQAVASGAVSGRNEVLAWIWGITVIVVLVTLGFDLNRNYTIFWLVLIGGCWALILWLRDVKSVKIFSQIYDFFANLNPQYSRNFGLLISIILAVLYVVMWIWTRLNSKWRITHNEFEHYQFGRMDDSLARGAKRVSTNYPDLFELLLCLAGDLVIYDSLGRRELRRIPHVPLLPMVRRRINRILERTMITAGEVEDENEEEEETL